MTLPQPSGLPVVEAIKATRAPEAFFERVAEARERMGPERIGVFIGTSTSGVLEVGGQGLEEGVAVDDAAAGRPEGGHAMHLGLSLPEHGYHAPNEYYDWGQASGGMKAFVKYFDLVSRIG